MTAKCAGTAVLKWTDPDNQRKEVLVSINARSMLAATALDSLPIVDYWLNKRVFNYGDKLEVYFISSETTATIVLTAVSTISIPITVKNTRTGKYEEGEIEIAGKRALTQDVLTGTKDAELRVAYYTCPIGISFVLGKKRAFNSRLLLDIFNTN